MEQFYIYRRSAEIAQSSYIPSSQLSLTLTFPLLWPVHHNQETSDVCFPSATSRILRFPPRFSNVLLLFLLLDPIQGVASQFIVMSPRPLSAVTVFQAFLAFNDRDGFEGSWPGVLGNVPHRGFGWCFVMTGQGLGVLQENHRGPVPFSSCHTSRTCCHCDLSPLALSLITWPRTQHF